MCLQKRCFFYVIYYSLADNPKQIQKSNTNTKNRAVERWEVFTDFCSIPELANHVPHSLPQANPEVHYSPGRVLTHI